MTEPIKVISKAFEVLEVLHAENDLSLKEITIRTTLPKPTAYRILFTLQQLHYVEFNSNTKRHSLSEKFVTLARGLVRSNDLVSVARPYMVKLRDTFGETVNLGKLVGNEIIFLHIEETAHQFRYVDNIGDRASFHSTSIGKAICAFRPDAEIDSMLKEYKFTRFTRHTITSLEKYLEQMPSVRKQGFALDNEEGTSGVRCIAVPIFDQSFRSNAAISISMPKVRASRKLVREIEEELPKIGIQVSIEMGVTDIRKCFSY